MRSSFLDFIDTKGSRSAAIEPGILEWRPIESLTFRQRATFNSVNGVRADSVVLGHQRLHNVSTGIPSGSNRTTASRVQPAILSLQVDGGANSSRRGADDSSSAAAPCFACLSRRKAAEEGFYTSDPDANPFLCDEDDQEDPLLVSALRSMRSALASLSDWSVRLLPSRPQTIMVDGKPAKLREHLRTSRPKRPSLRSRPSSDPGGSSLGKVAASLGTPSQKRLRFATDPLAPDSDGASELDAAANTTAPAGGGTGWGAMKGGSVNDSVGSAFPSCGNASTSGGDVATLAGGTPVTGTPAPGVGYSSLPGGASTGEGPTTPGLRAVPIASEATSSVTSSAGAMHRSGGSSSGAASGGGGGLTVRNPNVGGSDGEDKDGGAAAPSSKNAARIVQSLSYMATGAAAATPTSESKGPMIPSPVSVGTYARQRNSDLASGPSVAGGGDSGRANSSGDAPGTVSNPSGGGSSLIATLSSRRLMKPLASRGQIVPVGNVDTHSGHYEAKRSYAEAVLNTQPDARLPAPLDLAAQSGSTPNPSPGRSSEGWGLIAGQSEGAAKPTEQQPATAPGAPTTLLPAALTSPAAPPPTPTAGAGSQASRSPSLLPRLLLLTGTSGSPDSCGGSTAASECGRDTSRSAHDYSVAGYQNVYDEVPRQTVSGRVLHNALFEPGDKSAAGLAPGRPPEAPLPPQQPQQSVAPHTTPGMTHLPAIEGADSRGNSGDGSTIMLASTTATRPQHQCLQSHGSHKHKTDPGKSQDRERARGRTPTADPAALQWWTTVRPLDEDEEEREDLSDGRRRHSGRGKGNGAEDRALMMHTLEGARRTCSVTDSTTAAGARWRRERRPLSDGRDDVEDEDEAFMRNLGVGDPSGATGANIDGGGRNNRHRATSGAAPHVSAPRNLPLRDGRRSGLTYADLSNSVQQAVLTVQAVSSQKHRQGRNSQGGCASDASPSPKASSSIVAAVQRSQQIRAAPFAAALGLLQPSRPSVSTCSSSASTASQFHLRRSTRTFTPSEDLPSTRSLADGLGFHSGGVPTACTTAPIILDTPPVDIEPCSSGQPCTYGSVAEADSRKGIKAAEPGEAENGVKGQGVENEGEAEEHPDRWAEELSFIITDSIPPDTAAALLESSVHPVSVTAATAAGHPAAGRRRGDVSDAVDGIPIQYGSALPGRARGRSFAGMSMLLSQTLAARMEMTSSGPHTIYRSDRSATANNIRAAPFAAVLGLLHQRPRSTAATAQSRAAVGSGLSFTGMPNSSQSKATTEPVSGVGIMRVSIITGRVEALRRMTTDSYAANMQASRALCGGGVGRPPSFRLPGGIDSMDDVSMDHGAVAERRTPTAAAATSAATGGPSVGPAPRVSLGVRMRKPVRRSITESVLMGRDISVSSIFPQKLDDIRIPGQLAAH